MKANSDLGQRILRVLRDKGKIEMDHLAYMTGTSIKEVEVEALKLKSLDIVNIEGDLVSLRQGSNFTDWDRLKK